VPGPDDAGEPALAAEAKDGAVGAAGTEGALGAEGENLGILAAAVAWEAAFGEAVAVGADSDGVGP
jgi:hypothetical protein